VDDGQLTNNALPWDRLSVKLPDRKRGMEFPETAEEADDSCPRGFAKRGVVCVVAVISALMSILRGSIVAPL
jgi:hypothetical protein